MHFLQKCIRTCPSNNEIPLLAVKKVYASWRKNTQRLKDSASGGIGAVLAEHWIADDGIVCGTEYDKNFHPHMQLETTAMGIEKFKGSKYVQSETGYMYSEVRELLVQGKRYCFWNTMSIGRIVFDSW